MWLLWFLSNHDNEPLVQFGLWKSPRYLVLDYGMLPEIDAVRAAYQLQGEEAAWPVLIQLILDDIPADFVPPDLPDGWNASFRWRGQRWVSDHGTIYGKRSTDK